MSGEQPQYTREEAGEINQTLLAINFRITQNDRYVGGAFINMNERSLMITEFLDNEHFSGLESLIIQLNNSSSDSKFKVLVNLPTDLLKDKIQDILQMCEVDFAAGNKKDFSSNQINNTLSSLLKESFSYKLEESEMELALAALSAAIDYMNLKSGKQKQFTLKKYTLSQYLRLDVAALKALNVFPQNSDGVSGQAGSIFGMLNQCRTSIGARLLKKWLKQPTTDRDEINQRLAIVEFLYLNDHVRKDIQMVHLKAFPDLEKLYAKFYRVQAKLRNNAQLVDCVKVYNMIFTLQELCKYLDDNLMDEHHPLRTQIFDQLKGTLDDFSKLREMLEQCIDIGKAKQNDYIINPRFSPELSQIDSEINKVKRKIEDLRRKVEDDLECNKPVNLVESQMHTFVFECDKKEGDAGMRKQKKKYNYKIISIKNKIMSFSVQELKDLVREYNELEDQYRALQNELVLKVLEIASTYYPLLETVSSIISQLDVLCAFAMVSSTHQYVKPLICPEEKEQVYLIESKHPLIHIQDPATCINNDCRMVRNKTNLQIITGPNMGGKSTYIRQVAICVLLAHIGCFVPCSKAEIPIVDCIIARVGASDHQLRGISTFMAEMLEASCMLKTATKRSLIIMDELGRGTSTNEGFGLAWAIAEYIATEINCFCLFATHFHEMTAMEQELPNVKNLYVSALAVGDQLTMLYKVKEGVIDRSYGIHVAEMLKFPEEVLKEAKALANELENFQEVSYKQAAGGQ